MTGRGILAVLLAMATAGSTLWAQERDDREGGDRPPERRDERGGDREGGRGGDRGRGRQDMRSRWELARVMWMRDQDADGDFVLGEEEMSSSFKEFYTQSTNMYALLVNGFDADADGKLNEEECTKVGEILRFMMMIRRYDENKDLVLDEDELDKVWDHRVEMSERYNDLMLSRFDKDGDAALSDEEREAANKEVEAMQKRMEEMRSRFGGRGGHGGGPGGHGGGPGGRPGGGPGGGQGGGERR